MKNDTKLHIQKNKNNGAGVPIADFNKGKHIMTNEADAQFASVENGTMLGVTIYGM